MFLTNLDIIIIISHFAHINKTKLLRLHDHRMPDVEKEGLVL